MSFITKQKNYENEMEVGNKIEKSKSYEINIKYEINNFNYGSILHQNIGEMKSVHKFLNV